MKKIVLWRIKEDNGQELDVEEIQSVQETHTENQLEEVITRCCDLLMEDLKLIGRQTETPGGPLDLLGVDSDGHLVVFELKRGTLTREAVAQIVDYSSHLATLESKELSEHISSRSGKLGIEKIEDFLTWYQEEFGKTFPEFQRPRMVLVGLGADDRTKRMVSFLAESELDISLTTFHGFERDDDIFLARQVEVEAKPPIATPAATKKSNLEKLKKKVQDLGIENYYYDMSAFFFDKLPAAYQWPNQGGYSYYLPEFTERGQQSNRVYVALYIYDAKPGKVRIYLHSRTVSAAGDGFRRLEDNIGDRMNRHREGAYEIWVNSKDDWNNLKAHFEELCPAIESGWKRKREQQSEKEFKATESISISEEQTET